MPSEIVPLRQQVPGWELAEERALRRHYSFPNYRAALAWVNAVSWLAEREGHHPDIELRWGFVGISLTTHAAGGLTENDFVLAAKIDALAAISPGR